MIGAEIQNCLDTICILIDTREQPSERAERRYKSFSRPYRRQKLEFGDYSAEFVLPNGTTTQVNVAIERKMNLEELSNCLTHDRARFKAEFERAKTKGASVYLLIEDATFENLINGRYKTQFNAKAFFCSVFAWIARYDLKPIFCKHETSGKIIEQILYREIKESLERGDYG